MFKVKDVIEFLEAVKTLMFIISVVFIFALMGQTVEQPEWDLLDKTPVHVMLVCAGISITAQLIVWLIQFGSRDKPEAEIASEEEVDSVLAKIQLATDWIINAKAKFQAATHALDKARLALNEAELDYKRERHN